MTWESSGEISRGIHKEVYVLLERILKRISGGVLDRETSIRNSWCGLDKSQRKIPWGILEKKNVCGIFEEISRRISGSVNEFSLRGTLRG